ncbi:MAG: histidinol-phosphate transaminase [Chloroflexota bacterium]|nr:histidinol-phosphate transaminase [Chloroflexota bacterium]
MSQQVKHQSGLDALDPYVPGTPVEEVQRQYGLEDVIKLASNENPLGPAPKAVEAIRKALPRLNTYPDGESRDLRQALAEFLDVAPSHVTVGNGADGIIMGTCMAYLDEESEVVVSRSSFPVYDIYTRVMRARLIKTPLREYRLDLDAMAEAITPRTRLVFVCNPNNPTGTIVTADEVSAFMERVPEYVLVVFDEAYYELVDADDFPETLAYVREGRRNVLVLRTFSKVFGLAGVRLGYGVAVPEVLEPLQRVKEPFAVNLLAQAAGIGALEDESFLKRTVEMNRREREFLYAQFEELGLEVVPSHTNFILVKLGPDACQVQEELKKQGVIVRPCAGYDIPQFLRITVGDRAQNERLVSALETVLGEVAGAPS